MTHPDFNDTDGVFNDIVLLKLRESVNVSRFNLQLNAICLTDSTMLDQLDPNECYITGWGRNAKEGDLPGSLQQAHVPLVNDTTCLERVGPAFDASTQVCAAGTTKGGLGTCYGDSGGPLQCYSPSQSRWYLVGITSYGHACALPNEPDVFTRVSAYHGWINETMHHWSSVC